MSALTSLLQTERIFYIAAFGVGLLTGVHAMLNGSVRIGHDPSAIKPPSAAFNSPVFGAAFLVFGAIGYLVAQYSQLSPFPTFMLALLAALGTWIGMTVLMATWALKGPIIDPHEELEELQGTIALVTRSIGPSAPGEIEYTFRGQRLHVPAQTIGGDTAEAGTEVVIEKIGDGIADVELWSVVEQRL